ncbi:TPA: hypothetical protein N0F65_007889, partial [Lagenidium giganteum]
DESDTSADTFIELLDYALDTYALEATQLCFYVSDHASVNASVSFRTRVPMIGYASHRLQLAVQQFLQPYEPILSKVHGLMAKLDSVKNRHCLCEAGCFMAVAQNATRWSSTYAMIIDTSPLRSTLIAVTPSL